MGISWKLKLTKIDNTGIIACVGVGKTSGIGVMEKIFPQNKILIRGEI
jgi:hypothetical protein